MLATYGLVDMHCHLDLYPNHQSLINECEDAGLFTLAVTTTPKAWIVNNRLAQVTRHVRAALGLHPQLVKERANEFSLWESYLAETRYVGEVGLDAGPRFYKSLDLQKQVFKEILLRCAKTGNKILTIHSIRATTIVLDHIEAFLPPGRGKIVLHWFTGSVAEVKRAIDMGCYFSINSTMLANERHATVVASIPFDKILTETDGPFTQIANRSSKPVDVVYAVEKLAKIVNLPATTVALRIRENLKALLS